MPGENLPRQVWNRQTKFTYNDWLAALVKGKCSSTKPTRLATGVVCHPDSEQNRPYKIPLALPGFEPGTYCTVSENFTSVSHYSNTDNTNPPLVNHWGNMSPSLYASGGVFKLNAQCWTRWRARADGPEKWRLYPVNFRNKLCILTFIILSIWQNFFDPPPHYSTENFLVPPWGNSKLFLAPSILPSP